MIDGHDVVYISGPMSGIKDANRAAFNACEAFLKSEFGCSVLNPARHPDGKSYAEYMELAMRDLQACSAVVTLPGVENSFGACFECFVAGEKLGKPTYSISEIVDRETLAPDWFRVGSSRQ